MGGLVIDIYVEFLYRLIVSLLKRHRSNNWPRTEGEVMSSQCPQATYGCEVAQVYYKYRLKGELYVGIHERGFILNSSGKDYAHQFSPKRRIIVRVKPTDASVSVLQEAVDSIGDQRA
jgi:uncharacterized protein DUF3592